MKKFISGLIIGVIITTLFTTFAVGAIKEAYFNTEIKVNYNGNPVDIEKVTVIKEGEVYGRTYGSINDIAIALGKSVSWDNATKTINITDTEVKSMSTVTETTQTTTIDTTEWISLRDLIDNYNVKQLTGRDGLFIFQSNGLQLEVDSSKLKKGGTIETNLGNIEVMIKNYVTYLKKSDLEAINFID